MQHVLRYFRNFRYRNWEALGLLTLIGISAAGMAVCIESLSGTAHPDVLMFPWILTIVAFGMVAFDLITGLLSWFSPPNFSLDNPATLWHVERYIRDERRDFLRREAPDILQTAEQIARMIVRGVRDPHRLHTSRRGVVELMLQHVETLDLTGEELRAMFQGVDPAGYADVVEEHYGRCVSKGILPREKRAPVLLAFARAPSAILTPETLAAWNASRLVPSRS